MIKKIMLVLLCLMLFVGCSSDESNIITVESIDSYSDENYDVILPFNIETSRYWFSNVWSKLDAIEVPKTLQEYSIQYFPVEDNYLQSGTLLSYDEIQMLQRRESSNYPYGLNPSEGDFKINDSQTVQNPYIVGGVYELNFMDKENPDQLNGIAVAILMDNEVTAQVDGVSGTYTIADDYLLAFGTTISYKLENYLRSKVEVDSDLPIYIMLYDAASSTSYVAGTYFAEGLFTGRSGQLNTINEEWLLAPSDSLTAKDGIIANKFQTVKSLVNEFMPENVSMIGEVKFVDDYAVYLKISITIQAKNYTEMYALALYLKDLLTTFDDEQMEIVVEIDQMDETVFVLEKSANESIIHIIDLN
ncbi:MAG: CamS family sex pheromone protein [Erysipelotrichaceae bacterium]